MTADVASITVSLDHLERICKAGLLARGATEEEATLVYQDYLDAELRGRHSHGLAAFHLALREFPIRGHFEIIDSPDSLLRIRANGACGHVVARRAVDMALAKISSAGVCLVGIQDSTRFNSPGPIARYAVARDLIAVVLYYGGENLMAAPHGIRRALSTNPIGIGIPTKGAMPPFVLDIATSERAMGYITLAKLLGQDIPSSWAADASGSSTTDPYAVSAVKPFAGHKGFGIALAVEILVGPLLGVPIGTRGSLGSRGTLMALIHPTAFGETYADFLLHTSRFLQEVKASGGGDDTICYPGEAGEARYRQAMESGSVTLPIAVMDKLIADLR